MRTVLIDLKFSPFVVTEAAVIRFLNILNIFPAACIVIKELFFFDIVRIRVRAVIKVLIVQFHFRDRIVAKELYACIITQITIFKVEPE